MCVGVCGNIANLYRVPGSAYSTPLKLIRSLDEFNPKIARFAQLIEEKAVSQSRLAEP